MFNITQDYETCPGNLMKLGKGWLYNSKISQTCSSKRFVGGNSCNLIFVKE